MGWSGWWGLVEAARIKEPALEVRELQRANAILKSASACLSRRSVSAISLICQHIKTKKTKKEEFGGLADLCHAQRGWYTDRPEHVTHARRSRPRSTRSLRETRPCAARSPGFTRTSYSVPGARKMHALRGQPEIAEGHSTGHVAQCTVERLLGDLGLHGIRRTESPRTTRSAPKDQRPADLVRHHFEAFAPGGLWVADIPPQEGGAPPTCAPSPDGSTSPSPADVYSRRIIGWQPTGQCAPTWLWTP